MTEKAIVAEAILEKKRRRAAHECVYFINSYLCTFDPRPEAYPHHLPFDLYDFQLETAYEIIKAIEEGYDLFIEKSRDMGISWLVLGILYWCWLFMEGFQALVGSRKEDYVDNGSLDSLFGKFDYFNRTIKDSKLLPHGFDPTKQKTYMRLTNPENGNTVLGESSNPNFSRGGRYKVVFYDELGFWKDARNAWQAGGDATRCRIAVTTPPNEPSFAKALRYSGKVKVLTIHWSKHPHKDYAWYEAEKQRRTEEEVLHELDISWEYTKAGRPYPESDKLDFNNYPYDKTLPLYLALDIGLDAVSIGWYQPVRNSNWITLLEAYENSDRTIEWYYPFFGLPIDSDAAAKWPYTETDLKLIEMLKLWPRAICFGDPSGKQRHVESGISAYKKLEKEGIYVQTNEKMNEWLPRRDETKKLLGHLRVNDTPGTRWWHECIKTARYPKREENAQNTSPIAKPVHDWTSHHRTQTEYFAVNYKGEDRDKPSKEFTQADTAEFTNDGFYVGE